MVGIVSPSEPVALLREDPDLAAGIPEAELAQAERLVLVPAFTVAVGRCDVPEMRPDPGMGLLLLEGLVTVNVVIGDRVASTLAGPGDTLYGTDPADALLPMSINYVVSTPARFAALDRTFLAAVRRWPALLLTLHARLEAQERRLAIHAALGKLRRVEDRVLALLWHLAERWGRVTADGVVLPLTLTHETLGRLAGAERPTVSLAMTELARAGAIVRRDDGAFVLGADALQRYRTEGGELPLRPLGVRQANEHVMPPTPERAPAAVHVQALWRRLATLREELPDQRRHFEAVLEDSRATSERSAQTRRRIATDRARRRSPG